MCYWMLTEDRLRKVDFCPEQALDRDRFPYGARIKSLKSDMVAIRDIPKGSKIVQSILRTLLSSISFPTVPFQQSH